MSKNNSLGLAVSALDKLTDEELGALQFIMPWQMDVSETSKKDEDGFRLEDDPTKEDRTLLQRACWDKFNKSPFVGTAIRGQVGRLTGMGFEITSEVQEIQDAIIETEYDPRNHLFSNWTKFTGRSFIEGELFLILSVHPDGFIEVDFMDPSHIAGGGDDGIIYHPSKTSFPLFYYVTPHSTQIEPNTGAMLIPSINIAYYPELMKEVRSTKNYNEAQTKQARNSKNAYNKLGGFNRFIVSWDRSFMTRRNVSYLRTVIEWLNHYENLKKYEIDHKKSAGAYVWIVKMDDPKTFRQWLALSDEDRKKTGIMAKKTPGSTLVLPPGMTMEAINPKLPSISEEDTDILHMVTGGLNEPEDIATGQSKGTFASVKSSRGPMSDRTSDEIAYFDRFLKFDFYRAVFFLKSKVSSFPETFTVKVAVDFKGKKPVFKEIEKRPEFLVDIAYPASEINDAETRAKAMLGVKHGSLYDILGIPNNEIAKKMGFGNYRRLRLAQATEEERFPKLEPPVDAGEQQKEPNTVKKPGEEKKEEPVKKKIVR